MKPRLVGTVAICCTLGLAFAIFGGDQGQSQTTKDASGAALSEVERDLLREINQARALPSVYASYLEKLKPQFKGKDYTAPGKPALTTEEGWSAVEEAIKFMRAAKPLGPLATSPGLCLAALSHVKDQSGSGATGHRGGDTNLIEQRVKPFGTWQGGIGENLAYGNESARERLLTWLIDDGFGSRGHRMRIMSPNYRVAGVSCGPHPQFQTMCVLTLAGGFIETQAAKAAPPPANTAKPKSKPQTNKGRPN